MSFQDKHRISDELIMKYILSECNAEEQTLVESWLKASNENIMHHNKVKNLWDSIGSTTLVKEFDSTTAWEKVNARISNSKIVSIKRTSSTNIRYWSIAASLIIGIVSFLWIYNQDTHTLPEKETLVYKTSLSGILTDTLPDKSIVCLNKESEITYPDNLGKGTRIVHLKGEAFFNVTHDAAKAFIVKTENAVITVLGTSFNVNAYQGADVEVIVNSGIVSVKTNNDSVVLYKNEKAVLSKGSNKIIKTVNDNSNYNYYQSKHLTFNNTELEKVVFDLNIAYHTSIMIESEKVKKCKLTATFRQTESLDNILNIISETLGVSIKKESNSIIVYGKGC